MMDVEMGVMGGGYPASVASGRRHDSHYQSRSRTSGTSRTMSRNVRRLQETVNIHLNHYEKELFLDALNEYHSQKDTWAFVELLRTILNTPAKQKLVPMIRLVLPPGDITEFDKCVQLSAAIARGDHGAGRLAVGASSPHSNASHRSRANSSRHSTAPVRLRPRSQSRERQRSHSTDRHRRGSGGDLSIIQIVPDTEGLGFTIQSGARDQPGIYISTVDTMSDAFTQGLSVGDEILEANDIDLSRATSHDAALILDSARSLTLTVRHSGHQTVLAVRQETYTWVNSEGRSCSPPPQETEPGNTLRSSVSRRSGMSLISSQDERKINLRIEKGHGLGLTIRGGSDYGLGIYITGVDHNSAAERSGIRVGDQILSVNDVQCVDITHREAVKALKRSRHMMLTIKHVGKLPHAKIDRTKLLTTERAHSVSGRRSRSQTRRSHSVSTEDLRRGGRYPGSLDRKKHRQSEQTPAFTKGAGSQLMLSNSTVIPAHNYTLVDEQARNLLNDNERGTLKFYLDEYSKGYVSVDALVAALKELFNTHAKFQMFHDLRPLIQTKDVDKYDQLVVKYEVNSLKSRLDRSQDQMSDFSLDSVLSAPSNSSTNESVNASRTTNQKRPHSASHSTASTLVQNGTGSVRSNKMFITDGSNQSVVTDPQSLGPARNRSLVTVADVNHYSSAENSPRDTGKSIPRMGMRAARGTTKQDLRNVNDEREVDIAPHAGSSNQSESHYPGSRSRKQRDPRLPVMHASDTDSSSSPRVHHHSTQSYSLSGNLKHSGSDEEDSEMDHIPGLDSDLDNADNENVVLVRSKDVGTLPRRHHKQISPQSTPSPVAHEQDSPSTTFREQVKNRSALTGKMYLPPTTSQRHEIPLDDSDYDTSDIINISKELFRSASIEESKANNAENSTSSHRKESFNIRDILPPPPDHLLHGTMHSSGSTSPDTEQGEASTSNDIQRHSSTEEEEREEEKVQPVDNTELHPAVVHGRSPKTEKKSPRAHTDKSTSKDIYAVVKKQTPKSSRPAMTFEPPPPVTNGETSHTIPTAAAKRPADVEEAEVNNTSAQEDKTSTHEEVIRVNKLRPTLGLAIEGGAGTKQPIPRIKNILEAGCASSSGLKIGQIILRVNDKYLDGLSHNQAARVIADAFRNRNMGYLDFLVQF